MNEPAKRSVPGNVESFIVEAREDLQLYDPMVVHITDYGQGRVAFVVACYDMAWSAYFSNIGQRTPAEFIKNASIDYLATKLRGQFNDRTKRHQWYRGRVVRAVQAVL